LVTYTPVPVPLWVPVVGRPPRAPGIPNTTEIPAERQTASLGLPSINDTPTIKPSKIAWDSYKRCTQKTKVKYGKLVADFCRYMDVCDNSGFKAEGIAVGAACSKFNVSHKGTYQEWGKRTISGPLCNRWHPDRRTAWIAKMYDLARWYEANRIFGCTMISLTGYQENDGMSWYDTFDNINESRVKLLKILRKYLGKLDYFWVVEPHTKNDTGYPHYHLVVFTEVDNHIKDTNGEGMEDKLRRLYSEEWKTGSHTYGLDFKVMKGETSIENLKNYLLKYISKGYVTSEGWSDGELIFNAHLYGATHKDRPARGDEPVGLEGEYNRKYRLVGMSRNLSRILKPEEKEKEQIVWLHVDETEPIEIKNEKGELEDSVQCKPLYDRLLIPDFIDTWRKLAKIQSWRTRVIDEKLRLIMQNVK
jgi:hypothetical protein